MTLSFNSNIAPVEAQLQDKELNNKEVFYLAAPQNLNPNLQEASPEKPILEDVQVFPMVNPVEENKEELEPAVPLWQPESITVDFRNSTTNFGQNNIFMQPRITGVLPNGDRLSVTSAFNQFQQPEIGSIENIPLQFDWQGKIAGLVSGLGTGIDWFNTVTPALSFRANSRVDLSEQANLSFFVEHAPYKFNAKTIDNEIKSWRYGPNLFWQISPDTSFFGYARWGRYNDGNSEQRFFSRLEQTSGEFKFAANLFNWRYREDKETESGYFSPADLLAVNGEIVWEKKVFSWLSCRLSASAGQQHYQGEWDFVYGYTSRCRTIISPNIEWDLDYSFSNIIGDNNNPLYNNEIWKTQLRMKL